MNRPSWNKCGGIVSYPFDIAKYMIPARAERLGHLFPAQPLGPARLKPGMGLGQAMLPYHPGHPFHPDPTGWTVNATGCVDEKYLVAPHRDKLETPPTQPVVARPATPTSGTQCPTVATRMQLNFKRRLLHIFDPADRSIHKRFEFLHSMRIVLTS